MKRREFLQNVTVGATAAAASASWGLPLANAAQSTAPVRAPYRGPNVIVARFGGGVRRQETIHPDAEHAPFLKKTLAPLGVLFPQMEIASKPGVETSHGQGTMHILIGDYDGFRDANENVIGDRFVAEVPTIFEAFRKQYDVPEHQALIVNGEDRIDEEFYSFSNHHLYGINYRSTVLSLYRYKLFVLRNDIANGVYRKNAEAEAKKQSELKKLEELDFRTRDRHVVSPELDAFWAKWADYYGRSGFINPRGDRLLAELAVQAMRRLQPKLMMVNFQDPDYVHWGNPAFYTRGVTVVDECLCRLHEEAQRLEAYRDNTVFVVVPDCGRDNNPLVAVPYQHHFNSPSSRKIFLAVHGPGIDKGRIVDRKVEQINVAATVAAIMKFPMEHAKGEALKEVFA